IRSDAARQAVDEVRAAAGLLKEELSSEPGFELSQSQNALIEHRLDLRTARNPWLRSRSLYAGGALLAAASLFLVVYVNWTSRKASWYNANDKSTIISQEISPRIVVEESAKPTSVMANRKQTVQQAPSQVSNKSPLAQIAGERQGAVGPELMVKDQPVSQPQFQAGQLVEKGLVANSGVAAPMVPPAALKP